MALIVAGGARPNLGVVSALPPPVLAIAADSGVNHARSFGIDVDLVVGDFDSADPSSVAWARDNGAEVEEHPAAKDETDLELAFSRVVDRVDDLELSDVVVIALGGGRVDHWLANILALDGPVVRSLSDRDVKVTAFDGRSRLSVVRGRRTLIGRRGELVSLLPISGRARGVSTEGLVYPLSGEELKAGTTRGISNMFGPGPGMNPASTAPSAISGATSGNESGGRRGGLVEAQVSVKSGTLIAIQPHAYDDRTPDLLPL